MAAGQRGWLHRIDVVLGVLAVLALAWTAGRLPQAGAWGWGGLAAVGITLVFAVPVAVVFGRRAHRMLLETPVLLPVVLLLPAATAVVATVVGAGLGTWWRTRGAPDHRAIQLRTVAIFTTSTAVMVAVADRLEPDGAGWLFVALALTLLHITLVLPVPVLRARANTGRRDPRPWRQLGPSLLVSPFAALTGGAVAMLVDARGPIGLAALAPMVLLLAGGHRLAAAQQDRRRLDALYALALDTSGPAGAADAVAAAVAAARQVLPGATVERRDRAGQARDASVELTAGCWIVATRAADSFSADERDLLSAVGRLAATAAHRAELHHELARQERIRTALLAAAGHDLQTPLAVQLGLAETLQLHGDRLDAAQVEDLLARLAGNARRMARTVAGLVDLERLELADGAGGAADVATTVQAWADDVDLPNGRRLELRIERGTPTPVGLSPACIERIVENLVGNAARHSPREEPIVVRVQVDAEQVLLAVEDRGPGVPIAERTRIFEALQQGSTGERGTVGLGLFIVSRFAEHGGGHVAVHDRDGGGASFQVRLPLRARGADDAAHAEVSARR